MEMGPMSSLMVNTSLSLYKLSISIFMPIIYPLYSTVSTDTRSFLTAGLLVSFVPAGMLLRVRCARCDSTDEDCSDGTLPTSDPGHGDHPDPTVNQDCFCPRPLEVATNGFLVNVNDDVIPGSR